MRQLITQIDSNSLVGILYNVFSKQGGKCFAFAPAGYVAFLINGKCIQRAIMEKGGKRFIRFQNAFFELPSSELCKHLKVTAWNSNVLKVGAGA